MTGRLHGHIGVTHRLDFLKAVLGPDFVQSRKILIEKIDQVCRLGPFRQQRKILMSANRMVADRVYRG